MNGLRPDIAFEGAQDLSQDSDLDPLDDPGDPLDDTISRDATRGKAAEDDASLQAIFNRYKSKEALPAAAVRTASATPVGISAPPATAGGGALADYQMQLMLLEQQKKKRELMARQEKEVLAQPGQLSMIGSLGSGQQPTNEFSSIPLSSRITPRLGIQPTSSVNDNGLLSSARPWRPADSTASSLDGLDLQSNSKNVMGDGPGNVKEWQMDVDVNSSTPTARFLRSLITTISSLEAQVQWLQDENEAKDVEADLATTSTGSENTDSSVPRIYAVQCEGQTRSYHDKPHLRRSQGVTHAQGAHQLDLPSAVENGIFASRHAVLVYSLSCPHSEQANFTGQRIDQFEENMLRGATLHVLITSQELRDMITIGARFEMSNDSVKRFRIATERGRSRVVSMSMETVDGFYFHHRHLLQNPANEEGTLESDEGASQASKVNDDSCNAALRLITEEMKSQWGGTCSRASALFDNCLVDEGSISLLYHPNMPVIHFDRRQPKVGMICDYPTLEGDRTSLRLWSWSLSGKEFVRTYENIRMQGRLHGQISINSLDVYPLKFASDDLKHLLLQRGLKYWRLKSRTLVSYTGTDANDGNISSETRMMIDMTTYHKLHRYSTSNTSSYMSNHERMDGLPTRILSTAQDPTNPLILQLMPPFIYGFNFQDKKWTDLIVENIKDVQFSRIAYDHLMLPLQTKELVRALVETQQEPSIATDVVEGKGNGLILLLHGGPGTGKTLTAESVAEIAKKPLYRVTCGDIGTDPDSMEKYLNGVLMLGRTWDCVILFDEADVFLEEREVNDLIRNSIVSVFLRTLEYYEGILILTSNRVGTFDEAFKSRIQVAIHYPPLSRASRGAIWRNLLELLETADPNVADFTELRGCEAEIVGADLNGRQIRNALSTARRLASFRKQTLAIEHVRQVIDIASRFTKYLDNVHKHTDDERQRELGIRY